MFISIGGFLGALTRYVISHSGLNEGSFPFATLMINVIGCFIIGVLLSVDLKKYNIDKDVILGASTGFCGALTTFSTMCKETVNMSVNSMHLTVIYLLASVGLGMLAVFCGVKVVRK